MNIRIVQHSVTFGRGIFGAKFLCIKRGIRCFCDPQRIVGNRSVTITSFNR